MTALDQLIATTPSGERVNLLGMTRVQLEAFFLMCVVSGGLQSRLHLLFYR